MTSPELAKAVLRKHGDTQSQASSDWTASFELLQVVRQA